jgi:hypothetical protein
MEEKMTFFENPEPGFVTIVLGFLLSIGSKLISQDDSMPIGISAIGFTLAIWNYLNPKKRTPPKVNYNKILLTTIVLEIIIVIIINISLLRYRV